MKNPFARSFGHLLRSSANQGRSRLGSAVGERGARLLQSAAERTQEETIPRGTGHSLTGAFGCRFMIGHVFESAEGGKALRVRPRIDDVVEKKIGGGCYSLRASSGLGFGSRRSRYFGIEGERRRIALGQLALPLQTLLLVTVVAATPGLLSCGNHQKNYPCLEGGVEAREYADQRSGCQTGSPRN